MNEDDRRPIRSAEREADYNTRRANAYRAEGNHAAAARADQSAAEDRADAAALRARSGQ